MNNKTENPSDYKLVTVSYYISDSYDNNEPILALKVMDLVGVIRDFDNWLREEIKYNNSISEEEQDFYYSLRGRFREFIEDRGFSLDDIL